MGRSRKPLAVLCGSRVRISLSPQIFITQSTQSCRESSFVLLLVELLSIFNSPFGGSMNKLNILVVGGAGYIGSHIVADLCEAGHNVIVFDNLSFGFRENVPVQAELIIGDLRNEEDLRKALSKNIDVVYHFAALKAVGESMVLPEKYAENNIMGTLKLLNIMAEHNVKKIIFSSSAAVYGEPQYMPIDENHPINPENYYGYTKVCIEENLKWFDRLKGIKYAALRYFNATGYDLKGRVNCQEKNPANLSPIIMEVASGQREKLLVYGNDYSTPDGTCIRDYIHVNDLAEAHLLAMDYLFENDNSLVINLGTGKGHSVIEMVKAASEATGRKIAFEFVERRPGDPKELMATSLLAKKLIDWEPKFSDLNTIFSSMKKVYNVD